MFFCHRSQIFHFRNGCILKLRIWIPNLHTDLSKLLKEILTPSLQHINFKFILCNPFNIGLFSHTKEWISKLLRSSVTYKCTFTGCNDCYLGETSLNLQSESLNTRGSCFSIKLPYFKRKILIIKLFNSVTDCITSETLFIKSLNPSQNIQTSSIQLYTVLLYVFNVCSCVHFFKFYFYHFQFYFNCHFFSLIRFAF